MESGRITVNDAKKSFEGKCGESPQENRNLKVRD